MTYPDSVKKKKMFIKKDIYIYIYRNDLADKL